MKIKLDDQEIFNLEPWEISLLEYVIKREQLWDDCKRRLEWVLKHKIEQSWERFEKEWTPKLRNDQG